MEMHKQKQGTQAEIRRIVWSGGGGLVTKSFISCARTLKKIPHCTANVIQTTADHIDDHNWQYSPTGLTWTSHVTD